MVFDSFARFRLGREENSADQMAELFAQGVQPISREFGAAVLLLDHVPKDAGRHLDANRAMRGSGEKAAQTDRLWYLKKHSRETGLLVLEFGRAKDGPDQLEGLVIQRHHTNDSVRLEAVGGLDSQLAQDDPRGVLGYLESRGSAAPQQDVARDVFRGDYSAASKAIAKLEAAGRVTTSFLAGSKKAKVVALVEGDPEGRMAVVA